jgi:hypothetical protein
MRTTFDWNERLRPLCSTCSRALFFFAAEMFYGIQWLGHVVSLGLQKASNSLRLSKKTKKNG